MFPRATVRHWLTGNCAAADETARDTICKGMNGAVNVAKRIVKHGGDARILETCERAAMAAQRAKEKHTVAREEYEAMAQVLGAQLPSIEGAEEKTASKEMGHMDGVRRLAMKAAGEQIAKARNMGWGVVEQRGQREEHRGWLKLTLKAWAAWSQGRFRVPRLMALERAEKDATRESVRASRRKGWVEVERKGKAKKLVRVHEQLWWARLRQKVRAMAAWALEVRGNTMEWYVKGRGRSRQPAVTQGGDGGGRAGAERDEQQGGRVRRKVAAQAAHATREGVRLAWWLMRGEGADARGPISVVRGAPRIPTQR